MLEQFRSEISKANPEYFILVHLPQTWDRNATIRDQIFYWCDQIIQKEYHLVGLVDSLPANPVYVLNENATVSQDARNNNIEIYKRNF